MRTPIALFVLAIAAAVSLRADARVVSRTTVLGDTVIAEWNYSQNDVITYVNVIVTNNNFNEQGGRTKDAFVNLQILQTEISTGNILLAGVAITEEFEFTMSGDMSTAHLVVNDAIFQDDSTFTFFNVDMDLTWSATDATIHHHDNNQFSEPGLKVVTRFSGNHRSATASGSVFGKNTEFIPAEIPPTFAELQFNRNGELVIATGADASGN